MKSRPMILPRSLILSAPWTTYVEAGWISLGDWLGTGAIAPFLRQYRPLEKAREPQLLQQVITSETPAGASGH
jgi:hypothetical protein